jgi:predicted DNA-binding protein
MGRKKLSDEKDVVWPIRMKISLQQRFKELCDKNGYSMSKRVKILMEKDINEAK